MKNSPMNNSLVGLSQRPVDWSSRCSARLGQAAASRQGQEKHRQVRQEICRRLSSPHSTDRMASPSLPLRPRGMGPSAFTLPMAGSIAFRRLCSIFSSLGVVNQQHDTRDRARNSCPNRFVIQRLNGRHSNFGSYSPKFRFSGSSRIPR